MMSTTKLQMIQQIRKYCIYIQTNAYEEKKKSLVLSFFSLPFLSGLSAFK